MRAVVVTAKQVENLAPLQIPAQLIQYTLPADLRICQITGDDECIYP